MSHLKIDGVVPIVPTPFLPEGSVDWNSMERLLNFAVSNEVSAVCLPAYASEFYKLNDSERRDAVVRAVDVMRGRLPVIGQVNHVSSAYVAETATELEAAGASGISVAVPRMFGLAERDLLRYFDRILKSISIPLLIQDFNPGGPTLSLSFVAELNRQHPHFRYLKLEEPLMSERVRQIVDGTSGAIGVLEGWGGMYMIELIGAGICGVMPGLSMSDILQRVWTRAKAGDRDGAYDDFIRVLPQITYSLQSLEFFHHAEKALLVARGVLPHVVVREATLVISSDDQAHIEFLNRQMLKVLEEQKGHATVDALRDSHEIS